MRCIRKQSLKAFCALVVAGFGASASAATTPLQYFNYDTRSSGAYAPSLTPVSPDLDGSLKMQTFDATSNGKASVVWLQDANAPALGTLGSLTGFSYDFNKSSSPATPAVKNFAVRLWLNQTGTLALVYENDYNGSGAIATDTWFNDFSLLGGNFWQRGNGANFNGGTQAQTLATWMAGYSQSVDGNGAPANSVPLSPSTPVYGAEVAYGSGVGPFTGYADDVTLAFGANTFKGDVTAVPEPGSIALLAVAGATLIHRRRKA